MNVSAARVRAITRKELREYRRNIPIVATMAVVPLVFVVLPMAEVFGLPASSAQVLSHGDALLYMLGIPTMVPAVIAAYAVVGEREQGTLEPVLTTPIRREELLLAKALAVLLPSLAISYAVYGLALASIGLFARPAVATAVLQGPQILAQVVFTPLLAAWSIWLGIGFSARFKDVRVAQQLSVIASLPEVAMAALIAFGVIHATLGLALGFGAALLVLDIAGWRVSAATFDRERLITR